MRYIGSRYITLSILAIAVLGTLALTGCDFLDQLFGSTPPGGGTADAPRAVMTVQINDSLVDQGMNPDHRPPIFYEFNSLSSLDEYGDPIRKGIYEVAWDFGDGTTRGFEWGDYVSRHLYSEEGAYTATLTVRAPSGAADTAQKTITIGPAWLKILSLTTNERTDGQFDVIVNVQNQSNQNLGRIAINLVDDNGGTGRGADVTFDDSTPLVPGATYTLRTVIASWTGTLRALSWWCYPVTAS